MLKLTEQRKKTSRHTSSYRKLAYDSKIIENAIEDNSNMRVPRAKLFTGRHEITKIKDGGIIFDRRRIAEHIKNVYTHYNTSTKPDPRATNTVICNEGSEDIPEIS